MIYDLSVSIFTIYYARDANVNAFGDKAKTSFLSTFLRNKCGRDCWRTTYCPTSILPIVHLREEERTTFPSLAFKAGSQGVANGIEYTQACP